MTRRGLAIVVLLLAGTAWGAERFPPPDFTDHQLPVTQTPVPRTAVMAWADVIALASAIGAASYLGIRRRSRRGLVVLTLASLAYFGFYRKGCICAVGAVGNVAQAAFVPDYIVPLSAVIFFLLPLLAAVFFGRTFCAAVCPLGAIQDVVLVKPVRVPRWLEHGLGVLPYLYLGSAVLLAATGAGLLICQYDPFVSFFRLSGRAEIITLGVCLLAIGLFVGRPYCRFLCPYGAILRPLSRLAKWHASITPDECIRCRLCEDACPFNAIDRPAPPAPPRRRGEGKVHLALLMLLLPALTVGLGWLTSRTGGWFAGWHPTVQLADRVRLERSGAVTGATKASDYFRATGGVPEQLYVQAGEVQRRMAFGGWLLGGFVGLVVGGRLVALSIRRTQTDYTPNRAACLSCGRCFRYCPREQLRLRRRASTEGIA